MKRNEGFMPAGDFFFILIVWLVIGSFFGLFGIGGIIAFFGTIITGVIVEERRSDKAWRE